MSWANTLRVFPYQVIIYQFQHPFVIFDLNQLLLNLLPNGSFLSSLFHLYLEHLGTVSPYPPFMYVLRDIFTYCHYGFIDVYFYLIVTVLIATGSDDF